MKKIKFAVIILLIGGMIMSYTRVNWQNAPSTATPVNAENLNTMDKGIADAHSQLAETTQQINTLNAEVEAIPNQTYITEKAKIVDVNNALALKADQSFVDSQFASIVSGAPKGTYTDLTALQTAYPNGAEGIFLVLADGHWYYWNSTTLLWTDGGIYLSNQAVYEVAQDLAHHKENYMQQTPLKSPLENLVKNGNFANGETYWAKVGTFTPIIASNTYSFTALSTGDRLQQQISSSVGDKIYRRAIVKSNSGLVGLGDAAHLLKAHSGNGNFEALSHIRTETIANRYISVIDTRTVGFDEIQIKSILAINLTKVFGLGSEPSLEEMDKFLSIYTDGWFDGIINGTANYLLLVDDKINNNIKYIENIEKIIINGEFIIKNWELGSLSSTTGGENPTDTRIRTDYIKMKSGTIIKSTNIDVDIAIHCYSLEDKTWLQGTSFFNEIKVPFDSFVRIIARYKDDRVINNINLLSSNVLVVNQIPKTNQYVEKARELLYKYPGTLGQGITFVGDELWGFLGNTSSDETTFARCYRYALDAATETVTDVGAFFQNWGHCNTVDYCNETDTLILGSGTGLDITNGYGDNARKGIYLFPNTSNFKNVSTDAQITLADYGVVIELPELASERQLQAIWGENNNRKYNICYVMTNNGTSVSDSSTEISDMFIYKILLGQGANNLGGGTFIVGKSGLEFNGTYKILNRYIGKDIYSPYECTQDAAFYNGKIYTGMGHDGIWIAEITLNEDGTFTMLKTRERKWYDDDGSEISLINQAMTIKDGILYVRVWESKNQAVALHAYEL